MCNHRWHLIQAHFSRTGWWKRWQCERCRAFRDESHPIAAPVAADGEDR